MQFKQAVADSRKLSIDYVNKIADARVISGATALNLKLIDKIGNFEDAVTLAAKTAKIGDEPELYYPKDKKASFMDMLSGVKTMINRVVIENQQTTPVAM